MPNDATPPTPKKFPRRRSFARGVSAVALELLIVFVGVLAAFWVENYRENRERSKLAEQIYSALHAELSWHRNYLTFATQQIDSTLATWDRAYAAGERPVPVYFQIEGSEYAPAGAWEAAVNAQVAGVIDPALAVDLGGHYNEQRGISDRYVRYSSFTETELLPWLPLGSGHFYSADGTILPQYRAHMDRLREFSRMWKGMIASSEGLLPRLAAARATGRDTTQRK